jgi:hypothetical protein
MAISDYANTDEGNSTVPGSPPIEIGEGVAKDPMTETLRRAIKRIMKDLKDANGTFAGSDGADGTIGGVKYTFSTSTSMANPTAGYLRFNDVAASTTIIAINEGTAAVGNPDISAWINSWDDGDGGQLIITEIGAEENFAIFDVSAVVDNTGWHSLTVAHVASGGSIDNDAEIGVSWAKNGVDGTAGLAAVAFSGDYDDLANKPTLGGAAALNVGTTAGTVAAGDDSRFTDAREWTAATVEQAEAETGTATDRRAWTAQRVAQSAVARIAAAVGATVQAYSAALTDLASRWTAASASGPASLDFREDSDNGTHRVRVQAPESLAGDVTATLPGTSGTIAITSQFREKLTADLVLWVRTDGNDSNDGLTNSSGGAFLTRQAAYNHAVATYDTAGYNIKIKTGNSGTWTAGVTITKSWVGGGDIYFEGDATTPSNVIISVTSGDAFQVYAALGGVLWIRDMQIQTTTTGMGIRHGGIGLIYYDKIVWAGCAEANVGALAPGSIVWHYGDDNVETISGNSPSHFFCEFGGIINQTGCTTTLTGTPAFSNAFAYCRNAHMYLPSNTYTGSATGARYVSELSGVIFTNGAGASYLPGDSAGSTATGGQYA